jgi:hypothetical protein
VISTFPSSVNSLGEAVEHAEKLAPVGWILN